jgi:hypothetical protein
MALASRRSRLFFAASARSILKIACLVKLFVSNRAHLGLPGWLSLRVGLAGLGRHL